MGAVMTIVPTRPGWQGTPAGTPLGLERERMKLVSRVLVLAIVFAALGGAPAPVRANVCPEGFALVANEELPVPAPPYGADINRNGFQCAGQNGQILLLADDVPDDVDISQCGSAFSPLQVDPNDELSTAKDRNRDGIICSRTLEIADAKDLEIFVLRDN
jgi:hypothetical protein